MSKPPHLRRATGTARGGSIVDKDRRAESAQADRRADLLERMRQRTDALPVAEEGRTPVQRAPTGTDGDAAQPTAWRR